MNTLLKNEGSCNESQIPNINEHIKLSNEHFKYVSVRVRRSSVHESNLASVWTSSRGKLPDGVGTSVRYDVVL
jgi:hypothetical protein